MGALAHIPVRMACLVALLAGCDAVPDQSPSRVELANIRQWNIVPRTSPKQLIDTFKRICLGESIETARAALLDLDYVPSRPQRGTDVETYYSDNRRPAVGLRVSDGGFDCTVNARARTGQTNAVEDYIADAYPKAQLRPIDGTERAWLAPSAGGILFTKREGRPRRPEMYFFGIIRPAPLTTAAETAS